MERPTLSEDIPEDVEIQLEGLYLNGMPHIPHEVFGDDGLSDEEYSKIKAPHENGKPLEEEEEEEAEEQDSVRVEEIIIDPNGDIQVESVYQDGEFFYRVYYGYYDQEEEEEEEEDEQQDILQEDDEGYKSCDD